MLKVKGLAFGSRPRPTETTACTTSGSGGDNSQGRSRRCRLSIRVSTTTAATSMSSAGARLQAVGRRICRKYRQASIRRMQQIEYDRLRHIVPALARNRRRQHMSKLTIIEETIRYIDQLHRTLVGRIASKTGSRIADNAHRLFVESAATSADSSLPPFASDVTSVSAHNPIVATVCEKDRRVPSYVAKAEALSSPPR